MESLNIELDVMQPLEVGEYYCEDVEIQSESTQMAANFKLCGIFYRVGCAKPPCIKQGARHAHPQCFHFLYLHVLCCESLKHVEVLFCAESCVCYRTHWPEPVLDKRYFTEDTVERQITDIFYAELREFVPDLGVVMDIGSNTGYYSMVRKMNATSLTLSHQQRLPGGEHLNHY